MNLELFGLLNIICVILFIATEFTPKKKILGVFIALLIIGIGSIVLTDGLQIHSGTIKTGTNNCTINEVNEYNLTAITNATYNLTNGTVSLFDGTNNCTTSENVTNTYSEITMPYISTNNFFFLIYLCIGIFGLGHYVFGINFLN